MATRLTVVSGANFDASVIPAGPLEPAAVILKREFPDEIMAALCGLLSERELLSEAEEREVNLLIGQRMGLNERTNAILDRVRARTRVKVTAEWEAAKAQARAQQEKLAAHHAKISELTRELNKANEAKSLAFAARDAAQEEKSRLSRYAEKRESDKANLLLMKREAEADNAAKESGSIQQQINYLTLTETKPIMERLNELMGEEARLNHYVTGASYTTELGIVVPSSRPL
jgi:hypothetical protein